jgi:hypothetical protein
MYNTDNTYTILLTGENGKVLLEANKYQPRITKAEKERIALALKVLGFLVER